MPLPDQPAPPGGDGLPAAPIQKLVRPFVRFMKIEAASGFVLLACTALALFFSNSEWAEAYHHFWEIPASVSINGYELKESLHHWINDGLMTIFFFVVGLEIKRELIEGELRDPRKAALPACAALGGMIVPALIYLAFQWGQPGERGWGIPMATDIAFVVGFLALLGKRVPAGLKIFLLSLAIVDDLGAVLVIAVFYTAEISWLALGCAAGGLALIVLFERLGVRQIPIYVIIGIGVWLAFLLSGIHPTVAGVILGLLTPASAWMGEPILKEILGDVTQRVRGKGSIVLHDEPETRNRLELSSRESISPLERLEMTLHPWNAFFIMPLFALANAGVTIDWGTLADPIAIAVATGLTIGKPLGIVAFSLAAVGIGMARLPEGVNWKLLTGAGCLGGIGFTMSLFIAAMALPGEHLIAGKIGTLLGSLLSAVIGTLFLYLSLRRDPAASTA